MFFGSARDKLEQIKDKVEELRRTAELLDGDADASGLTETSSRKASVARKQRATAGEECDFGEIRNLTFFRNPQRFD